LDREGYRSFRPEFFVGFERFALKVELDVPGELRAKAALSHSGNASAPGRHAPP